MNSISTLIYKSGYFLWKARYFVSIIYNKIKFKILLGNNCSFDIKIAGVVNVRLVNKKSTISIGKKFISLNGNFYNALSRDSRGSILVEENGKLIIGDYSGMSSAVIRVSDTVKIGNHVNVGADTMIMDTDGHALNHLDRRTRGIKDSTNTKSAPIFIEDDVFIGARSIIMKGVTIGARSIIGAGSVVVKSIPPDSIAGGNPCKVIKQII